MTYDLRTNAPEIFTRDGDFAGHALPSEMPDSIDTKFVPSGRYEVPDELVYVVRWSNGIYWETYSIGNEWHDIYLATMREKSMGHLRAVDRVLQQHSRRVA